MTIAAVALGPLVLIAAVVLVGLLAKVINRPSKEPTMTDNRIIAPWDETQVAALNAYQRSGRGHPFTCGALHLLHQTMIAEADGWHCSDEACDYSQSWAPARMVDPNYLAAMQFPGVAEHLAARVAHPQPGDWTAAYAEITRLRRDLRATEDQLAEQRRLNDQLRVDSDRKLAHEQGRVKALIIQVRMLDQLRKPVALPAPAEPVCGEIIRSQTVQHAGSIDTWEETL